MKSRNCLEMESPYDIVACREIFLRSINQQRIIFTLTRSFPKGKPLGNLRNDRFWIQSEGGGVNSFIPLFRGRFIQHGAKTLIVGRFTAHPLTLGFMLVWLSGVWVGMLAGITAAVTGKSYTFLLVTVPMLAIGLVLLARPMSCKGEMQSEIIKFLKDIFAGHAGETMLKAVLTTIRHSCIACLTSMAIEGEMPKDARGAALFRPDNLTFFRIPLDDGVLLKERGKGCLECGLVWTGVEVDRLIAFLERFAKKPLKILSGCTCVKCGSSRTISGTFSGDLGARFRPDGILASKSVKKDSVALEGRPKACLECGAVWAKADPTALTSLLAVEASSGAVRGGTEERLSKE